MAEPTVFLVEDDAAVRKGCEQALSIADIAVRGFADGEGMLAALASATPALVVSDIACPAATASPCSANCANTTATCRCCSSPATAMSPPPPKRCAKAPTT